MVHLFESWLFAASTLSYLAIMGVGFFTLMKIRRVIGQVYFQFKLLMGAAITVWMIIASMASFNIVFNDNRVMLFGFLILLVVPMCISVLYLLMLRYIRKDADERYGMSVA